MLKLKGCAMNCQTGKPGRIVMICFSDGEDGLMAVLNTSFINDHQEVALL